jgi:hypothetical protein
MTELIAASPALLAPLRTRAGRRDVTHVVLEFAHDARDARDINHGLHACGCEVGSVFVFAALASLATAFLLGWRTPWWMAVAIVFGAAIIGKITGLVLAEWRLRAAIRRLSPASSSAP